MESSHGIGMLRPGRQGDDRSSIRYFTRFKPDQACDGNFVYVHVFHKTSLIRRLPRVALYATDWSLFNTVAQNRRLIAECRQK